MTNSEATITATADFAGLDTVSMQNQLARPDGFYQGATWSLKRLAAWLETTNFVGSDEVSQRAVDNTKKLIADQARHAAENLRAQK